MTLRTLNYGNYGIFLIMGHAGFCPSTAVNGRTPQDKGSLTSVSQAGCSEPEILVFRVEFCGIPE